jgi:hypothetical protein
MNRLSSAAGLAAVLALVVHSGGRATPPVRAAQPYLSGPACPGCPTCAYGPHAETVTRTTYGTKQEPYCVKRVTLASFFSHGRDCAADCVTRTKTRLVKCETTEEVVKLKCAVEPDRGVPTWIQTTSPPRGPVAPLPPPIPAASVGHTAPAPLPPAGPLAPRPPR